MLKCMPERGWVMPQKVSHSGWKLKSFFASNMKLGKKKNTWDTTKNYYPSSSDSLSIQKPHLLLFKCVHTHSKILHKRCLSLKKEAGSSSLLRLWETSTGVPSYSLRIIQSCQRILMSHVRWKGMEAMSGMGKRAEDFCEEILSHSCRWEKLVWKVVSI